MTQTALPTPEQCAAALDPEAVLAMSIGLQGYIYGYPIVDMLRQQHNETHRVRADQPVAAPINTIGIYPGVLTPSTQGQLRAANSDTLYLNAIYLCRLRLGPRSRPCNLDVGAPSMIILKLLPSRRAINVRMTACFAPIRTWNADHPGTCYCVSPLDSAALGDAGAGHAAI